MKINKQKLLKQRQLALLTQRELADKAGLNKVTICHIETKDKDFSITTIKKICKALDISINEIL